MGDGVWEVGERERAGGRGTEGDVHHAEMTVASRWITLRRRVLCGDGPAAADGSPALAYRDAR